MAAGAGPDDGSRRRLVELSHVVADGMTTLPGWPAPTDHRLLTREASRANYAPGTEFQIGRIDMVANTGTYLDTPAPPLRRTAPTSPALPLDRLADLPGVVVRVPAGTARGRPAALAPYDVAGRAVLLHTGWDAHFGTDRYARRRRPFLTGDGAAALVDAGAALVGIDSLNIDDMSPAAASGPAHTPLLAAGIPIVEHLTGLDALPADGFRFTAAPLRWPAWAPSRYGPSRSSIPPDRRPRATPTPREQPSGRHAGGL